MTSVPAQRVRCHCAPQATRLVPACVKTISPVPSPARIGTTVLAITPIIDSDSAVHSRRERADHLVDQRSPLTPITAAPA
jgi:hypothetical protein